MAIPHIILFGLFAVICSVALAADHSPLQDICVADLAGPVLVNGRPCKDPKLAQADDFFFSGLHMPGNTTNTFGSSVNLVSVAKVPGLNTLGISMARLDYAPWGLNPPHTHPRATEVFTVLEGSFYVGFVTSNPENRLISKVLQKGDAFVFPVGLIHFERNIGHTNGVAIASLSSQNPGAISIGSAVFGSKPDISNVILAHAFQVGKNVTNRIKARF
ncbi:hypothetical protein AQUCO_00400657v1 [Aquilegia coerulea]|uniref:Germin-like protein n=1 Tax=Aquilegia coerulea TaxID=218851 RepID=A0A2G5EW34_AQUCA|nr:hypothetical protein AQUCO_00400657v1 [Aquilegia coerulea]